MRSDLRSFEEDISRTKRELNDLFRRSSLASREGDSAGARAQHLQLLEKELENIRTIAKYVEPVSPPVARDLSRWHAQMESRFRELCASGSPQAMQEWVARELVPHLRRSEQIAHLLATSVRARPRKAAAPFGWPVAVDRAVQDAEARGRRARGAP